MIIIRIKGGMGNQLFQYALYKKLSVMGKEVYVDLAYYTENQENRIYELPTIGLHPKIASDSDVRRFTGGESRVSKITRRLQLRSSYYRERNLCFDKRVFFLDDVYLNGYWQSEQYFADIRELLLEEIDYPIDKKEINAELYDKICNTESVCVTIRRGDYIENRKYKKMYFSCDEIYFKEGMMKIKQDLKNPTFFAFSDDIEWVREHVSFPGKVYFETGLDPIYEKLRLMTACKHFVISNSSFSWWVQYLSRNPQKTVYAPKSWYSDGRATDIYQSNWKYV